MTKSKNHEHMTMIVKVLTLQFENRTTVKSQEHSQHESLSSMVKGEVKQSLIKGEEGEGGGPTMKEEEKGLVREGCIAKTVAWVLSFASASLPLAHYAHGDTVSVARGTFSRSFLRSMPDPWPRGYDLGPKTLPTSPCWAHAPSDTALCFRSPSCSSNAFDSTVRS